MNVNKVIELPTGDVAFQGVLTGAELEAVVSVGLNTLLAVGAMPYVKKDAHTLAPFPSTEQ